MFKKAVVIIHGFAGNMSDNETLARYITFKGGFDVYSYTLKGHDKTVLKDAKYTDWIYQSEQMIEELQKKYKKIYIVGHSMGGVIASHIAAKYKIKKVVFVSSAFEYISLNQNKKDIPNISKIIEESNDSAYEIILAKLFIVPIPAVIQFIKLVKKYKNTIKEVTSPALFLHGNIDEVIPVKSSENAYNNIKSKKKYITTINNKRHAVFKNDNENYVADYVYKFLKGGLIWKLTYKKQI